MLILDGKLASRARMEALKPRIQNFFKRVGRVPHLVVVVVGNHVASEVYVRNKIKSCEAVGLKSSKIALSANTSQQELNDVLDQLNDDPLVDGILVQLPLPEGLDEDEINQRLSAEKDSDGFTFNVLGRLWAGQKSVAPCTPQGVMNLLEYFKVSVSGMDAVVVGRSMIVGKPMAHLLTEANATVTICHSKTKDLRKYTLAADLVVVAAGKKHLLGRDDFKKGAIVVDVGMHGSGEGRGLAGDVRFSELDGWVSAATPVPGGVGPMTISTLLENTVTLAELKNFS
jgi:methylenetetrahydrofolate dehydrogenase (NADP+)/methenyltetrahydrofolate cyclohydrolase